MTIATKLEALGFGRPGVEIDAAVNAALDSLGAAREALVDLLAEMRAVPNMDGSYSNVRIEHGPRINEAYRRAVAIRAALEAKP